MAAVAGLVIILWASFAGAQFSDSVVKIGVLE